MTKNSFALYSIFIAILTAVHSIEQCGTNLEHANMCC